MTRPDLEAINGYSFISLKENKMEDEMGAEEK